MFSFIYHQILFFFAIILVMFIPGYFLLLALFGKDKKVFSSFERFVFSFGLSLIIVDFIAFAYSKLNFSLTSISSILGSIIFCAICFGIYKYKNIKLEKTPNQDDLFSFSKKQIILIFLLLFLTIFIRTAYLTSTVAPTSTDMGHHLYWAKQIVETGKLPVYEGMPDFIIGEHIVLSELSMISKLDFFSALPVVFLFLINILGILTVFLFTLRIFKNKNIAILSLLFLGVLFAVSSPQVKFVSGGVMGNILGNFLMPMTFYFFYRAFENFHLSENSNLTSKHYSKIFLALAVFSVFGLFYTHHLTAFIFLFSFAFLISFFLIINFRDAKDIFQNFFRIVFSVPVLATFFLGTFFFFFVFTPTYIKTSAVKTAVGTPSKTTREGLTFNNLKSSVGEARITFGIIGVFLLALSYKRRDFGLAVIFSWTTMLFIMSVKPELLFINLPSSRIGNYLSYPLSILSAFAVFKIFSPDFFNSQKIKLFTRSGIANATFIIILTFVFAEGLRDSAEAFKKSSDFTATLETFNAANYLKKKTEEKDVFLKDHNYLTGDTWMKLFFMRGYTYPLSRSYFKRYEDATKPREMCTLYMISNPDGNDAKKCFLETGTNYIIVNPRYDSSQFEKLKNFNEVYLSNNVAIYQRK